MIPWAVIEATTRLRRAVYHQSFRLGTLAFRALGPTEAVTVFARHVESVHEALFAYMTVYFRAPIKFGLLLAFALVVQPWLALAFAVVTRNSSIASEFKRKTVVASGDIVVPLTKTRSDSVVSLLAVPVAGPI